MAVWKWRWSLGSDKGRRRRTKSGQAQKPGLSDENPELAGRRYKKKILRRRERDSRGRSKSRAIMRTNAMAEKKLELHERMYGGVVVQASDASICSTTRWDDRPELKLMMTG